MWEFFTAIPSLISGLFGSINHVTDAIANERIAGLNATTDQERIRSQERVKSLEAKRDLMIAEASTSRLNIYMRSLIALGPMSVILKLNLWDKVIGSLSGCSGTQPAGTCGIFTTDPLDDNQWRIIMIVVGFYFLYEGAIGVTKLVKR